MQDREEDINCPKCNGELDVSVYSVIFSLTDWPTALLIGLATIFFGEFWQFELSTSIWFALLAIAPFCIAGTRKRACARCGVEFESRPKKSDKKSPESGSSS